MKWFRTVILVTILCAVLAKDTESEIESKLQKDSRTLRDYGKESGRSEDVYEETNPGWFPQDESPELSEQVPKRRRLRKRKRRPPVISATDDYGAADYLLSQRRKVRPQMLEQIEEPWEEMSEEAGGRPSVRRRVTPSFESSQEVTSSSEYMNIDPLTAIIRFGELENKESSTTKETIQVYYNENKVKKSQIPSASDLKTLLKQTGGGISLSEILQQKNLSLGELLKGDQQAISALTDKPQNIRTTKTEIGSIKHKRLPPSIGLRKNTNRNFEQDEESTESLSTKESLEAQRRRLALLHGPKDNKQFPRVTKLDVKTESTTERRIFVPSHPKYYTSLNFKPDFNLYIKPSTESVTVQSTTKRRKVTTSTSLTSKITPSKFNLKPKLKGLPITNAKINRLTTKTTFKLDEKEDENYPSPLNFPKPIKIDINDVSGFRDWNKESKDEPLRMSIDLESIIENSTQPGNGSFQHTTPAAPVLENFSTEMIGEKITQVTAKEEIMEILQDPKSREKLSKILESRNMTIEELVQQRERGSSQLHLADIFHNETREPEPKDEPFIGTINSNFPLFDGSQKSSLFKEITSHHPPIVNVQPTVETVKENSELKVTSFPTFKIEMSKNVKEITDPFLWKELYPDFFPELYEQNNVNVDPTNYFKRTAENYFEGDVQRLDDIGQQTTLALDEKLKIDENYDQQDVINTPSSVKSAIFVSLAIVTLSMAVFLTILIVFKWIQRKKRKLNYCKSFSSKIKSPIILQNRPKTSLKTFVVETLGRKKKYYNSNVQSMCDDIWESNKETKPYF